jgi:hypothetical protein
VTYVERTDDDLLALSREGVAAAFAVLLYRYGPEVLDLADGDPDPIGATVATFVRAMRALPEADPDDVRTWLLTLAADEIDAEVAIPPRPEPATVGAKGDVAKSDVDGSSRDATRVQDRTTIDAPTLETDDDLDEVWAELALRWPTGKVPRHLPSWVIWLATTLILIALAIALPWAILGASADDDDAVEELRASPVHDDLTFQEEVVEEDEEPEPLPTFDFPQAPTDEAPEAEPETEAPAAPAPAPAPAPSPAPGPVEEPAEEPPPTVAEETEAPAEDDAQDDEPIEEDQSGGDDPDGEGEAIGDDGMDEGPLPELPIEDEDEGGAEA